MRTGARRIAGRVLVSLGVLALAWAFVTWQWKDPLTGLYTTWQQKALQSRYDELERRATGGPRDLAAAARRFRRLVRDGDPIGRLRIPRLGLRVLVVNGADPASLKKGPGRDVRSSMPGEGELVYVAGHRTTYLAPFADLDRLRPGDRISFELPYGALDYVVTGHRIVADDDTTVLRSPGGEALRLQACHPRFFATHRYVVFATAVAGAERARV
jgi:sortase A